MNTQMSEFISPKQLEEWIGLSVIQQERIRRHIGYKKIQESNPLLYYKIAGAGLRYKRSEIVEWVERQRVTRNA